MSNNETEIGETKTEKKYMTTKKACSILGVNERTLRRWHKENLIETLLTPGRRRLYNVEDYLNKNKLELYNENNEINNELIEDEGTEKLKINYARVSSVGQKSDLENQKNILRKKYPKNKLIEDIGSGINLNRRGLRKIIKLAIAGRIEELVIVHRDRLTRFGYELIEDLIKDYSGGKIIILSERQELEPEEELIKDVLTIMNVFVARMNGMRKYKNLEHKKNTKETKKEKNTKLSKKESNKNTKLFNEEDTEK